MQFPDGRILIFAKAPEPGYAKTRLIPVLGARGAADFYRQLLESTVEMAARKQLAPLECCCTPNLRHPVFGALSARHAMTLTLQTGADLGARMQNAAHRALARCRYVLLIGGDCPALEPRHLQRALDWLQQGEDAVLAPAEDGGYVLLGIKRAEPALFQNMPWGGNRVLELTRQRLQGLDWRWRELEMLWDIDRPEDLSRFRAIDVPGHAPAD